jgi:hypothetical protein
VAGVKTFIRESGQKANICKHYTKEIQDFGLRDRGWVRDADDL